MADLDNDDLESEILRKKELVAKKRHLLLAKSAAEKRARLEKEMKDLDEELLDTTSPVASASVERAFSMLKYIMGDQQVASLRDKIEASLMLRFNRGIHNRVTSE